MCRLYTCNACLDGEHEKCEKGYGKKGCFGGGMCVCRCMGRSEKKWKADEDKAWEAHKKAVFSVEERAKRTRKPIIIGGKKRDVKHKA